MKYTMSALIKAKLMIYYKKVRLAFFVGDEIKWENLWRADVIAILSNRYVYEFEVKVSKNDLINDKYKHKHYYYDTYGKGVGATFDYSNGLEIIPTENPKTSSFCPNYFYYVVTNKLTEEAKKILDKRFGILEYIPDKEPEESFTYIRTAKRLHKRTIKEEHILKLKSIIASRYLWRYNDLIQALKKLKEVKSGE